MFFRVFFEHELRQIFIVWEKLRVSDESKARSTFGGGGGSGGGWWSERVSVPNKYQIDFCYVAAVGWKFNDCENLK